MNYRVVKSSEMDWFELSCVIHQFFLADEPTGALNDKLSIEVMRLLKGMPRHLVIVISHNSRLIKQYTKMIVDLDKKRIIIILVMNDIINIHCNHKKAARSTAFLL